MIIINSKAKFILIGICIGAFLFPIVSKIKTKLADTIFDESFWGYKIYFVTNNCGLLQEKDLVVYNGKRIGKVHRISLKGDGKVIIEAKISKKCKIITNPESKILSIGVMGEKFISINDKRMAEQFSNRKSPTINANDTLNIQYFPGLLEGSIDRKDFLDSINKYYIQQKTDIRSQNASSKQ